MNTKVYVGNLPYDVTEEELKAHFETQGKVSDIHLVIDKYTDQPRGFGFVTMEDQNGMLAAIEHLDGKNFGGRDLKINEARPRENNNRGGGFAGRGGNYNQQNRSGGGSRKGQRGDKNW
ncbi:RNA recognition motif domain-containing protein [Rubritalea tangerina]|uniref:RNA recognition motif domain-containing protein n=1 Tax=Rubritalea tangerina TaxID=430798 RepID=A0ABW4Z683_9BACT